MAVLTPMAFAESMYLLQGKPLRFGFGRNYLEPIHNAEAEELLMMTGRQVEKSTTESVKIANNVLNRPFSSSLYVAPLNEQVKTFSRSRLDKLFRYSQGDIIRKRYMHRDLVNQVFHKEFSNGAEIYLRNCFEDADNIRGLSIDDVFIDELQDIQKGGNQLELIGKQGKLLEVSQYRFRLGVVQSIERGKPAYQGIIHFRFPVGADGEDVFFIHGGAAAEFPGLRVMAAGAAVGAALGKYRCADARAVYDAVTGYSGQLKHSCSGRA